MKKLFLLTISICLANILLAQVNFDRYFDNTTMRFDYNQAGNNDSSVFYPVALKQEPFWAGSHTQLIDTFQYGDYMLMVYDSISDKLIYSRGYSTLFKEWRETPEAKLISRSYPENVVFPYPKNTVRIQILERNRKNKFETRYQRYINPKHALIEKGLAYNFETKRLHGKRKPQHALDIVILPDGYTASEMDKFDADAKRFISYFFEVEPFIEYREAINFWAVMAPSVDSGTDIPHSGQWRNTILNTHFYTFYSDRYLTTRNMHLVRNVAALVPYDQIYILVNTKKYGGGGIYNYYNLCSSDHKMSGKVFTHEFGHAFAALADEYAYSNTPPEDLYDLSVEPWQANITSLVDFESKWADLVSKGTPIPTPDTIRNIVGAYQGAGYTKTKIYRPVYDCKMRSNDTGHFCPVCNRAIKKLLEFYTK